MSESIFITGGAGLLGVNWATAVRDHHTVTLGLHDRRIGLLRVARRVVRLESRDHLRRALEETESDLVVHTAGMTNVDACEADPASAHHVNVELAENVARACAALRIALAHISSDHLFSGEGDLIDEDEPVSPTNVYGRTKAEAERRVLNAHPAALVVRTNFYGWGPSYRRSFSDVIVDGLRRGERLTLFHDVWYTPILMQALVTAVHGLVDLQASGVFNVASDDCTSKHAFGLRLARRFNLDEGLITPVSLSDHPGLVRRPRRMGLSNRKATVLLGQPMGKIDEHLATLLDQQNSEAVREIQNL